MNGATPTIDVRVYRDGRLIDQEICESDEAATLIVEHWDETEGTTCDDLYPTEWALPECHRVS